MISRRCQILLFAALLFDPAALFEAGSIGKQLDNIFLKINITVEDSKLIIAKARESYQTLKDFQKEKDPERKKELLTTLRIFTERVVKDIYQKESNISQIFGNINSYLKGITIPADDPEMEPESLSSIVRVVLTAAEKKLGEYYASSHRNRYDIERILATDTSFQNLFREDASIDATSIGFFFLETFATILGLSWGIISMILSGITAYE